MSELHLMIPGGQGEQVGWLARSTLEPRNHPSDQQSSYLPCWLGTLNLHCFHQETGETFYVVCLDRLEIEFAFTIFYVRFFKVCDFVVIEVILG